MAKDFYSKLEKLLKKDSRFVDQEGDLLKSNVIDAAYKADRKLVELMLSQKEFKAKFFSKIKDVLVFNINNFVGYIQDKNFLADSYTKYRNKIGLNIDGKFLNERKEVALVWPFKDCILEGGMTKEDEKRKEIFFNEILAQDEIDKLLVPKVLTNWKRYTQKGEEKVKELKRDENGTIQENLIIKGNNLLALHSLKQQFQNKIKLIYIDPPYNKDTDNFYNDNFKQSTWLTFMKNRLEIARDMMKKEGVIFASIGKKNFAKLRDLMDEIFGEDNLVGITTIKVATTASYRAINVCPVNVSEYLLIYAKDIKEAKVNPIYIEAKYNEDYSHYISNYNQKPNKWKLIQIDKIIYSNEGVKNWREFKGKHGSGWKNIRYALKSDFAHKNKERVVSLNTLQKPSKNISKSLERSKNDRNKMYIYKRKKGLPIFIYNGRTLAFYSRKFRNIDGKLRPTEILTNMWTDISFLGLGPEGGVDFPNGKKPEAMIQRIINLVTNESDKDIILDFFLGCGTTAAVAHKMGKQYIGIEQLDYGKNDSVVRLQNVIGRRKSLSKREQHDQSGISKVVKWMGGGNFVYCELKKYNEVFVEKIRKAKNTKALLKIWKEMKEKSFLNYNVDIKKFDETIIEFKKLSLVRQQRTLFNLLNKNQLYINLSEIEDKEFKVSGTNKKMNKKFYG